MGRWCITGDYRLVYTVLAYFRPAFPAKRPCGNGRCSAHASLLKSRRGTRPEARLKKGVYVWMGHQTACRRHQHAASGRWLNIEDETAAASTTAIQRFVCVVLEGRSDREARDVFGGTTLPRLGHVCAPHMGASQTLRARVPEEKQTQKEAMPWINSRKSRGHASACRTPTHGGPTATTATVVATTTIRFPSTKYASSAPRPVLLARGRDLARDRDCAA